MSNQGILHHQSAKLKPCPRDYVDRVIVLLELSVAIEVTLKAKKTLPSGRNVTTDLDAFFGFIEKPNDMKWLAIKPRATDIGQEIPLKDGNWAHRITVAEQKDTGIRTTLAIFSRKLFGQATSRVVSVTPYGSEEKPASDLYTIPGFTSREAFIATFLYSRHEHHFGPIGSLPHFYMESEKGTNELHDWTGKIKEQLYVAMSRGYFHVRWQNFPAADQNVDSTGRIIFSHSRKRLTYLKDIHGHLSRLASPPPPAKVTVIKHAIPEVARDFENLDAAITGIWSGIDEKWILRDHNSGDPKWPSDWPEIPSRVNDLDTMTEALEEEARKREQERKRREEARMREEEQKQKELTQTPNTQVSELANAIPPPLAPSLSTPPTTQMYTAPSQAQTLVEPPASADSNAGPTAAETSARPSQPKRHPQTPNVQIFEPIKGIPPPLKPSSSTQRTTHMYTTTSPAHILVETPANAGFYPGLAVSETSVRPGRPNRHPQTASTQISELANVIPPHSEPSSSTLPATQMYAATSQAQTLAEPPARAGFYPGLAGSETSVRPSRPKRLPQTPKTAEPTDTTPPPSETLSSMAPAAHMSMAPATQMYAITSPAQILVEAPAEAGFYPVPAVYETYMRPSRPKQLPQTPRTAEPTNPTPPPLEPSLSTTQATQMHTPYSQARTVELPASAGSNTDLTGAEKSGRPDRAKRLPQAPNMQVLEPTNAIHPPLGHSLSTPPTTQMYTAPSQAQTLVEPPASAGSNTDITGAEKSGRPDRAKRLPQAPDMQVLELTNAIRPPLKPSSSTPTTQMYVTGPTQILAEPLARAGFYPDPASSETYVRPSRPNRLPQTANTQISELANTTPPPSGPLSITSPATQMHILSSQFQTLVEPFTSAVSHTGPAGAETSVRPSRPKRLPWTANTQISEPANVIPPHSEPSSSTLPATQMYAATSQAQTLAEPPARAIFYPGIAGSETSVRPSRPKRLPQTPNTQISEPTNAMHSPLEPPSNTPPATQVHTPSSQAQTLVEPPASAISSTDPPGAETSSRAAGGGPTPGHPQERGLTSDFTYIPPKTKPASKPKGGLFKNMFGR